MSSFPVDQYTPHGYLDLPSHTRRLDPKGVLRSYDIGFRWHFPALSTSYGGGRETYRSGLRVGLDDRLSIDEFDRVVAPYHSKDVVRFHAESGRAQLDAEFHTAGDDVLCARIEARDTVTVRVDYERLLAADHGWGESGLVGRSAGAETILQGFEDGEAFVLWTSHEPSGTCITAAPDRDERWVSPGGVVRPVTAVGAAQEEVGLSAVLTFADASAGLTALYARGRTVREARARLAAAQANLETRRAELLAADDAFWSVAPRLEGDWPAHWRRGLVYDFETLRMMVKAPVGIYAHSWDAMQIQAPRVVLGEAAIDALLLSYADPAAAQAMLLGVFADAPEPNVPCSREDGSYNMVSAEGEVCGTGPQWGYPWLVIRRLYEQRPDRDWLAAIFVHCGRYLDWWLAHRRDADGWLVHACSWESGQDLSPRFGDQPLGGGHPTWTTRPVDLQAAFADAATSMAEWATLLNLDDRKWRDLAEEFRKRTNELWNGSRYADEGPATVDDDVMQWAPVALGLADVGQVAALRPAIRSAAADVWPMFVWTAVEAALASGEYETAGRLAASIVDRAYRFWDAPRHEAGRTLPGVACEYWPPSGRCGGEGYGWGAFTTHLLLGVVLGLRPDSCGIRLRPVLPADMRTSGGRYSARLICREHPIRVTLQPVDSGVRIEVNGRTRVVSWGGEAVFGWDEIA